LFKAYQWYKDGVAISGATDQYYIDPAGLIGSYSLKVTITDGSTLFTCAKVLDTPLKKKVSVSPNPVKANQVCTVEVTGFNVQELEGAVLSVHDLQGISIYESTKVEKVNSLNLPSVPQVYVGRITMPNGNNYVFKIIVGK